MGDKKYTEAVSGESRAAGHILDLLADYISPREREVPDYDDACINSPIIKVAENSLKEIQKHGGKVDVSLISALTSAEKQANLTSKLGQQNDYAARQSSLVAEVAGLMADELVRAGLVELPVIGRERGRGK